MGLELMPACFQRKEGKCLHSKCKLESNSNGWLIFRETTEKGGKKPSPYLDKTQNQCYWNSRSASTLTHMLLLFKHGKHSKNVVALKVFPKLCR